MTARDEMIRALQALYVQVPESVADDIGRRFVDYEAYSQAENERLRALRDAVKELWPFIHEQDMEKGELSPFKTAWLKVEAALRSVEKGKEG